MKALFFKFLFLGLFVLQGQGLHSQKFKYTPKNYTVLHGTEAKKLIQQCSRSSPQNVEGYFDVSQADIKKLESNFKKIYKIKSKNCCFGKRKVDNLKYYSFQYTGVIINGEKYLYINAFENEVSEFVLEDFDWKNKAFIICDGGPSFWGALFNLNDVKFQELSMNGVG